MTNPRARVAAVLALLPVLLLGPSAYAKPKPVNYGPIGDEEKYGYLERSNGNGSYTLLTAVPRRSSLVEARAMWDRRALELCPAGVAKRIIFRSDRMEDLVAAPYIYGQPGLSSRAARGFQVEGYLYCEVGSDTK